MARILPVNSAADREFQVLLGSNLLTVRTYWNATLARWHMDLYDVDGVALARGLTLVPAINVLEAETELTRTIGQFRIAPANNAENDTPTSLGDTCQLWWFAPGEFEAYQDTLPPITTTPLPFDVRTMYTVGP